MVCPQCGKESPEDAKFCYGCGSQITNDKLQMTNNDIRKITRQNEGAAAPRDLNFDTTSEFSIFNSQSGQQPPLYPPYYPPYPYPAPTANKGKTVTALVFGIISLLGAFFSLIMALVASDIGESGSFALFVIIFVSFVPFCMALTGLLLSATAKIPKGMSGRSMATAGVVLNSIALGLIVLACIIIYAG